MVTREGAQKAVVISATVVFGMYFYRHLTEGTTSVDNGIHQLIGFGTPANIGRFITAWGFVFLMLSIVAEASPELGASFAILVATGDALANGAQVAADVNKKLGQSSSNPTTTGSSPTVTPTTTSPNPTIATAPLHTTG